jgi:lipid-A-disaccharide synthase
MIESVLFFDEYQSVIAGAPGIEPAFYRQILKKSEIKIVYGKTYELLQNADVAIVNSGTATLETAIIGTPQVVVYHVTAGRIANLAIKYIIKVKYISLVNLIAQKECVKELIAHDFTVENTVAEIKKIIINRNYRARMIDNYITVKDKLGNLSAAGTAAQKICEMLMSDKQF